MPALKCPNSACPFLFDPAKVPAGALIACPRCQTRFRVSDAQPPAANPLDFANTPAAVANEITEKPDAPPSSIWMNRLPKIVIGGLLAVGLGALAAAISKYSGSTKPTSAEEQLFVDHQIGIRAPLDPWARDRDLENRLSLNMGVYTRSDPAASFGYAAQKYDTRNARASELDAFMNERLRKLCDQLQVEPKDGVTWLEAPAKAMEFRGTSNGRTIVGEAMAVSVTGIAYYFFAWSPEADWPTNKDELSAAKSRTRLLGKNSNWKEQASPTAQFKGTKAAYVLTDAESIWAMPKNRSAADQDPKCDLYIDAELKQKGVRTDIRPRAELLTYVLPGGSDPMAAAFEFVTKRESRNPELFKEFVFEKLTTAVAGDEPLAAPAKDPIPVTRIKMTHPASTDVAKLIVISAKSVGGQTVVVEAICPWDQKDLWEKRLVNLCGSLE